MKRKITRVLFVLLGLAVPFVAWRLWLTLDVNGRLAAVRTAGLPINGEELNRWYPTVPDRENVALVLTQAFALHRTYADSRATRVREFKLPGRNQPLATEQTELLRGYVEMNAETLARAEEALKLAGRRYPIDCSLLAQTPLPHLANLKTLVVLHQYAVELALQSGDYAAASKAVETMLRLAGTLDQEPCLISQLVRVRLLKLAVETLARRANAGALSEAEAANLVAAFELTRTTNLVARGLVGDRAVYAPYFRMSKEEASRFTRPKKDGEEGVGASLLPCNGPYLLRLIGYYELDFRYFLATMQANIALASLPPPQNLAAVGQFARASEVAKKRYRTMSGALFSALAGVVMNENEAVAYHHLAIAALAVEQFRNRHGRLPKELAELTPSPLAEVPEDPFTGAELLYRPAGKGYVIYSVGRDRKDNGGLEESEKKRSPDGKSCDLCFIVER